MSGFDPGPGWKELGNGRHPVGCEVITYVDHWGEQESFTHVWVREAPVPPLPTEPYTVIRVERGPEVSQVLVLYGAEWYGVNNPDSLDGITGFEVLAEPRTETAKAVFVAAGGWLSVKQQEEITAEMGIEL